MPEDAELLRRYADEKSEEAFAALVRRHLTPVYAFALHRVGGDAHLAKDVAQIVFTTLARKAASLTDRRVLGGWLCRTTHFAARDIVRAERRRRVREQEAQIMHESSNDADAQIDWDKLHPMLAQTMGELNDDDRDAVWLRFFEGRSFAEVGAKLKLSENTARMRVERALDKLHALLAKRGLTSTSSALAIALANQAVATAPAGLAASVTGAALSGAATAGAGSLAAVVALMGGSKITASLAALGAFAIGTAIFQSSQARTAVLALTDASRDHAALVARRADLETSVNSAEKDLADREAALTRRRTVKSTASASSGLSAEALAALAQKAKYDEAWARLQRSDPKMQELRLAVTRARAMAEYRVLFQKLGFTPEQSERAYDLIVEDARKALEQRAEGAVASDAIEPSAECVAAFRERFGPAAAEHLAAFERTRLPRFFVTQLSARSHFLDEPFTVQQAERLVEIVANHWSAGAAERSRTNENDGAAFRRRLDWDAILAQAGTMLSPAQLQSLRSMAAQARLDAQLAAAKHAAAVTTQ